ncbi:predicted protein [Naegleria gruberi]|uniref:Predicted protein n=1 Tax=Naegleria gruberi TaxID=5762 RepID=D2VXP9_NAEGR|nr:uncharacterized protein NAEGRDRAFT_73826 [Naegleria gruberi]EFC38377.1 predicted protein [Naegleria gruberi]|eukprot:XP_002671121.1 predicted protein [Naegleria gruberi strain NEG-M]
MSQQFEEEHIDHSDEQSLVESIEKLSIHQEKNNNKFNGENPNVKWKALYYEDIKEIYVNRYVPLNPPNEPIDENNCHLFPQRSDKWLELRSNRITASRLSKALGFFSPAAVKMLDLSKSFLKQDKETVGTIYESILTRDELKELGMTDEEIDQLKQPSNENPKEEIVKRVFMDWGSNHELNCVSTILNSHFDYDMFCETGFYIITEDRLNQVFTKEDLEKYELSFEKLPALGASPDGLLQSIDTNEIHSCVEIKCPTCFVEKYVKKEDRESGRDIPLTFSYIKKKPHEEVPVYYIPQMYLQMIATNTKQCYYCSWTVTQGCNMFKVEFDKDFALEILYWIFKHYDLVKNQKKRITPDCFISDERFIQFLQKSLEIQKGIQFVKTIEKSMVYEGIDPERKHMFNDNK